MARMEDRPSSEREQTELDELLASLGTARPLSEISVASLGHHLTAASFL